MFESLRPDISVSMKKILIHWPALIELTFSLAASMMAAHSSLCRSMSLRCTRETGAENPKEDLLLSIEMVNAQSGSSSIYV